MRKVIVANFISLDGYLEGPGNNVMALPTSTVSFPGCRHPDPVEVGDLVVHPD